MAATQSITGQICSMFEKVTILGNPLAVNIHENALFKSAKELLVQLDKDDPTWADLVTLHKGMKSEITLTLAHLAVFARALPDDFDNWDLKVICNQRSLSVATAAAYVGCLPASFSRWALGDEFGWTVAHAYAAIRDMPANYTYWELATHDGVTVKTVQTLRQEREF